MVLVITLGPILGFQSLRASDFIKAAKSLHLLGGSSGLVNQGYKYRQLESYVITTIATLFTTLVALVIQRAQYPLIKEYTLNNKGNHIMI